MIARNVGRLSALLALLAVPGMARAQLLVHPNPSIDFIYPAGGQQGQSLEVEIGSNGGLDGAKSLLIDGPPGVTAGPLTVANGITVKAKLSIAADAEPGPRWIRVLGGAAGLTSYRPFFVTRLAERLEEEPNNMPELAKEIVLPAVVNGRLDPTLDVDCFTFRATAGQKITAAVFAHGMDSKVGRDGYLDVSMELLDEQGKILVAAEDTVGLDPVASIAIPAAGRYIVRLRCLAYKGGREAVYRLTLGDIPYPTAVFPPGGRRGEAIELEFIGSHVSPGARQKITLSQTPFPFDVVSLGASGIAPLAIVKGDFPEAVELEPNNSAAQAKPLPLPQTINGRFEAAGDEDWYRLPLKQGEGVLLSTTAQRYVRSPVDTILEIHGPDGNKAAENDDGPLHSHQCAHDFASADSWLPFKATQTGDHLLRVRDAGGTSGPRAIYRLSAEPLVPDYVLYQWPDAVPVWGPGTTSTFVVQIMHWGGMTGDLELRIEGLPAGWTGSAGWLPFSSYSRYNPPFGMHALLAITAPADAPVGAIAPFQVVGRIALADGKVLERRAQPLNLYGNAHNDRMHLSASNQSRAVVAPPLDARVETSVKELTVTQGGPPVEIPVKIHRQPGAKGDMGISVDGPCLYVGCGWRAPMSLKADQAEAMLPLSVTTETPPGVYGITVCRSWAADLRIGRPGPCTPLIRLTVLPAVKKP